MLNAKQVDEAVSAGAKFIVSPGLNPKTVKYCQEIGIPVFPGVATASEIEMCIRDRATGSMKTVAIVVVDVRVPHYALTSYIMEQKLSEEGYMVLVCNTGEGEEDCRKYLRMLAQRQVDVYKRQDVMFTCRKR